MQRYCVPRTGVHKDRGTQGQGYTRTSTRTGVGTKTSVEKKTYAENRCTEAQVYRRTSVHKNRCTDNKYKCASDMYTKGQLVVQRDTRTKDQMLREGVFTQIRCADL